MILVIGGRAQGKLAFAKKELGVRLAGDAVYGGVVCKKEHIGDAAREIEAADIRRANRLMYVTAVLLLILTLALKTLAALAAGISL